MNNKDLIASVNQQHWENEVRNRCGFTQPWLNLDRNLVLRYTRGEMTQIPAPLTEMYPPGIFADVAGKEVLCLASGGGQQSAVFALLGARVTVVDLAEGQLEGDKQAALHYGYEVKTIHADMRDVSVIDDETFDLIYQAPSMAYIPDVRQVYAEVARLLQPGGLYRVEFTNPATEFVDCENWDGTGYRITRPYHEQTRHRTDGAVEFRHYLSDIFNGLLETGMTIQQVAEAETFRPKTSRTEPGSWEHWLSFISGFVVIAGKPDRIRTTLSEHN